MSYPRMAGRNRRIFLAPLAGYQVAGLAAQYKLRPATIAAILTTERHKCAVSPAPEYRALRNQSPKAIKVIQTREEISQ